MARKTAERREALRNRLIDDAERQIRENGLASLRARPLAEAAGCSVGAIYTVVPDLTALVLAVNGRTFRRLGAEIGAAIDAKADGTPQDRLLAMATAYLRFADANRNLWRSLFDVEMSEKTEIPAWYDEELAKLFAFISAPLAELHPDKGTEEIAFLTRTLFSSAHGIVLLGLERRFSAAPMDELEDMIAHLIETSAK
ncbi:TetR/AcrR family transcriptional regulator [Aestuariibius sp. 2305UL40-4]|uniref:TetR/AcrR family transcriptional regulator n=1 Tax=Aestuariibius violaceus TaxID=3234132 RepID=UPI00345E20D6